MTFWFKIKNWGFVLENQPNEKRDLDEFSKQAEMIRQQFNIYVEKTNRENKQK